MAFFDYGEYVPGSEPERAQLLQIARQLGELVADKPEVLKQKVGENVDLTLSRTLDGSFVDSLIVGLGSDALLGFGAMIGQTKVLEKVFPAGARFSLLADLGNNGIQLEVLGINNNREISMHSIALGNTQTGEPVRDELIVHITGYTPEVDPQEVRTLFTPSFVVSAASYVTAIAQNPNH